jgi:CBS domain-containing protein
MRDTIESVMSLKKGGDELISVEAGATVLDAVDAMAAREVGAVLVRNEDGLIDGIFTERDLVLRVAHQRRDPATTPISLVMTRDVRFVPPSATVREALALMRREGHRHLLVIDGPRVHGLISVRDLVNHLLDAAAAAPD